MKKQVRKLAKKAGFVFWDKDAGWGPGPKHIDWSCDYTKELQKLVELIVTDCADTIENMKFTEEGPSHEALLQRRLAARVLLERYEIVSKSPVTPR